MSYNGFKTNDMFGPKPVEVGKEYDVQITELSRKGDGIARIQRFVIFVKNGKVGQNTKIKIIQVGNRFATAEIVNDSESNQSQSQTENAPASADAKTETSTE
jgi:predicted RNA-binding protein with TRAM domain